MPNYTKEPMNPDVQTDRASADEPAHKEPRTPQNRGPIVIKSYPVARQAANNEARNTIDLADESPFSI